MPRPHLPVRPMAGNVEIIDIPDEKDAAMALDNIFVISPYDDD
jgi:hypothetical protein